MATEHLRRIYGRVGPEPVDRRYSELRESEAPRGLRPESVRMGIFFLGGAVYSAWDAESDEVFSKNLKARKEHSADVVRLKKKRLGKRPDRPMLVDFQKLAATGTRLRKIM